MDPSIFFETSRRPSFSSIDCQGLIELPESFNGSLRKQTVFNKWTKKHVVIYKGFVYIYSNEKCKGQESMFDLLGYKRVEKIDSHTCKDQLHVFKLVHSNEINSKYFEALTRDDLFRWIKRLYEEIQTANRMDKMPRPFSRHCEQNDDRRLSGVERRSCSDIFVVEPGNRPLPPTPTNQLSSKQPIRKPAVIHKTNNDEYFNSKENKVFNSRDTRDNDPSDGNDNIPATDNFKPDEYVYMDNDYLIATDDSHLEQSEYDVCKDPNSCDCTKNKYAPLTESRSISSVYQPLSLTDKPAVPYAVIAVQSYKAKHCNEISFQQEDKFDVVGFESERWLIGEIDGFSGLFPSEYVKKCTFEVPDPIFKNEKKEFEIIKQDLPYNVIAIQTYQAKHDNEISFMKDDKFDVVDKMTDIWLIGDINETTGLFPAYCVKKCNIVTSNRKSEASGKDRTNRVSTSQAAFSVIATQSYQAESEDELTFRKNQKFNVINQPTEGWLIGEINGKRGIFPSDYVTRVNLY